MTSIKCGNCGSSHDSVSAVRACYGQPVAAQHQPRIERHEAGSLPLNATHADQRTEAPVVPASEKQVAFIASLREQKGLEPLAFAGSKRQASAEITRLLALPKPVQPVAVQAQPVATSVPAGRYAVEVDGTVKFYKIDRPTEGRWAGRTFVKVQASDDLFPVRGSSATAVLALIESVGPEAAMAKYGHLIGRCGICGRTLTDEDSRARGIGPICASKAF